MNNLSSHLKNKSTTHTFPKDGVSHCDLMQQNRELKRKIAQSTPILESIYSKVLRKQQIYKDEIANNAEQLRNITAVAKDYKNYANQSLKILYKNEVLDNYSNISNFNSMNGISKTLGIKQHKISQSAGNLKQNIKMKEQKLIKNERSGEYKRDEGVSIYDKYMAKLKENCDGNRNSALERKDSTLNIVRRLSKQIDKDLQKLALNKNKSASNLSSNNPKRKKLENNKEEKNKKYYFLELQKRKIKLL